MLKLFTDIEFIKVQYAARKRSQQGVRVLHGQKVLPPQRSPQPREGLHGQAEARPEGEVPGGEGRGVQERAGAMEDQEFALQSGGQAQDGAQVRKKYIKHH